MKNIKYLLFISIRSFIYGVLAKLSFIDRNKIAVFCYHSIATDTWRFSTDLSEFKKQISYLSKSRVAISADDLFNHITKKKTISQKSFLIAFDDGYRDILQVKDFLFKKNIKPIVFVLADSNHAQRQELDTKRGFLSRKEVFSLKKAGWTIGCHSMTHDHFATLKAQGQKREIVDSKKILEKKLGMKIDYFAYPKGVYNKSILKYCKMAGYKMAFSMDGDTIDTTTDLYKIPRVGVDRTHSFAQFPAIYSLPVILIRKLL